MGQKDLKDFKEMLSSFYATDVGDFKRKAVTAINRYLEVEQDTQLKNQLNQIKDFVVCYNNLTSQNELDDFRLALLDKISQL